jgi:UDP-N-acetylmuramate: L-alanyl-gamma-D-glutamyl-meso-diaminopimelate ligase
VFQDEYAAAFSGADRTVIASVFRSNLPESERLSVERLIRDLAGSGRWARHVPETGDIVDLLAGECRAGDVVVVMSNGAFDGIHRKLVNALKRVLPARARVDSATQP